MFLCQLFKKSGFSSAKALRWFMFKWLKGNQCVEKLFPTKVCITYHIFHAHLQANIWLKNLVPRSILLDLLLWDSDNWRMTTMS